MTSCESDPGFATIGGSGGDPFTRCEGDACAGVSGGPHLRPNSVEEEPGAFRRGLPLCTQKAEAQ